MRNRGWGVEEHYKISKDRLEEIAALAGMDSVRVRTICTYPWPDIQEHQVWLDEAPAQEIAQWVRFIAGLEEREQE